MKKAPLRSNQAIFTNSILRLSRLYLRTIMLASKHFAPFKDMIAPSEK
jgi:hypothetical protein